MDAASRAPHDRDLSKPRSGERMTFVVARLVAVALLLFWSTATASAQQPDKVYRVAYLAAAPRSANQVYLERFRQGMRELGYSEGRNLVFESRFADGKLDRLPAL